MSTEEVIGEPPLERLSDFLPIEQLALPGIGGLDCHGLVVIVGPNSSGKSQLLRDLYSRIVGEPRILVVATDIRIKKPEYQPFVDCLKREGVLESIFADDGSERIKPKTTYGTGEAAPEINPGQSQSWHQNYRDDSDWARKRRNEFLNHFGKFLVTQLFLERRLTSLQATGVIDFQTQSPQHDLHALYLNEDARAQLAEEISTSFGKAIWPDTSRGSTICLRVSNTESIPSADDRLRPAVMGNYRQIETEGDGFKSYVATCVSLLLSRRPVCLIDEPELCLHPPQAYNLGRFIGRVGEKNEGVTFVSTHSSHVLRGAIQGAAKLQIVRLTRSGETFEGHLVSSETLQEALKKPTVRAESVLDGIFSQAVVIVEADTDRTVYQATWETLGDEFGAEVHFSPVGGVGGIADSLGLYKTLRIPVAVIADLDAVMNMEVLSDILKRLVDDDVRAELIALARRVSNEIKSLPPTISAEVAKKGIDGAAALPMVWADNDDVKVREALLDVARNLDRMARVKNGGVNAFDGSVRSDLESLLSRLAAVGLFLVPVGELEGWLATRGIQVSKKKKWAWANEASSVVRNQGAQDGDIWSFVRSVGNFLFAKK